MLDGGELGLELPLLLASIFDRNGPISVEVGMGTNGVDISVSDSQPTLIRTQN